MGPLAASQLGVLGPLPGLPGDVYTTNCYFLPPKGGREDGKRPCSLLTPLDGWMVW